MFDSGSSMFSLIRSLAQTPGIAVILFLSLTSTVALLFLGSDEKEEMEFWLFSKSHRRTYIPVVEAWNAEQPGRRFDVDGQVQIASPVNAMVLARVVTWVAGPNRIATLLQHRRATSRSAESGCHYHIIRPAFGTEQPSSMIAPTSSFE